MIRPLRDTEKLQILEAIVATGSVYKAAAALEIGTATIYRKIKKYKLEMKVSAMMNEIRKQRAIQFERT